MTMQYDIDITGRNFRRNVLQSKLQTIAGEIDNQWPVGVPIAISAHDRKRRPNSAEIVRDRRLTHIAQVPNLIRLAREIGNWLRQFVMRVRDNKYSQRLHSIEPRTTDTTGTTITTSNSVVTFVAFVRGLAQNNVI
jgi:hypothetical protein